MNKIILLFVLVLSVFSTAKADEISIQDSKALLALVETKKDFADAIDLLATCDNSKDLKADEKINQTVEELAKKFEGDLSAWKVESVEDVTDTNDSATTSGTDPPEDDD